MSRTIRQNIAARQNGAKRRIRAQAAAFTALMHCQAYDGELLDRDFDRETPYERAAYEAWHHATHRDAD